MSSSRLPGKVLKQVKNTTFLEYQIERIKLSNLIDKFVVATSIDSSDTIIEEICKKNKIEIFRGSLDNVLERFYFCARIYNPDNVIRITADCPLIDPIIIDNVIKLHIQTDAEYTSNILPRTYPDGLDVEIMKFSTLETVYKLSKEPDEKEHVTKFIHKNASQFKISNLENHENLSNLRWTLDTIEDMLLLKKIIESFENIDYGLYDIINKIGR